jgi:hypothetical protein
VLFPPADPSGVVQVVAVLGDDHEGQATGLGGVQDLVRSPDGVRILRLQGLVEGEPGVDVDVARVGVEAAVGIFTGILRRADGRAGAEGDRQNQGCGRGSQAESLPGPGLN